MDHRKSLKRDYSNDAMKADTYANDNMSLLRTELSLSIPEAISGIPGYSHNESLVVYDVETGCGYGLLKGNEMYYVSEWSRNWNRMVVADWKKKRLEMYDNEKLINMSAIQAIIDLDANGRRWEGGVQNGRPFGFGVLYNEDGRKEYEGFMISGLRSCYGIDYYSDIDKIQYDGCYYSNNRFGKGILYDRNGTVDYEGLCKDGKPFSPQFDGKTIDNHTESISIPNNSFNES